MFTGSTYCMSGTILSLLHKLTILSVQQILWLTVTIFLIL